MRRSHHRALRRAVLFRDGRGARRKKLKRVARALLGEDAGGEASGAIDVDVENLGLWGVSEETIAKYARSEESETDDEAVAIEVEPENCDAVRLFVRMQTQWRTQALVAGKHLVVLKTGLDYSGLPAIAAGHGIALTREVMDGIAIMEAEAMLVHEQRQREALQRS